MTIRIDKGIKVDLRKRRRKLPSGKVVHYWELRWYDSNGRERYES